MDERFTKEQITRLISSIRKGRPLPPEERAEFARTTKVFFDKCAAFKHTARVLAKRCTKEMRHHYEDLDAQWLDDVTEEIEWWWHFLTVFDPDVVQNWRAIATKPFQFEAFLQDDEETARVLNIGSGPCSTLPRATRLNRLEVVDMDPLATAYNFLTQALEIEDRSEITFGAVEILTKLQPKGSFDFIAAKNCLDHAYDVPRGLEQMAMALGAQGSILLQHWENEAELQNYTGLHNWNIEVQDGRIRIWNREREHLFDHEAWGFELLHERSERQRLNNKVEYFNQIYLSRRPIPASVGTRRN